MSHLPVPNQLLAMPGRIFSILSIFLFSFSSFIAKAQNVGVNTLEPKAGLHIVSNDGLLATGTFGSGIVQDSGIGTRLMWIPYLGAFRVGGINGEGNGFYNQRWDPDSIGQYSFAAGINTKASGLVSFAVGNRNIASGGLSTAIGGFENVASGQYSFVTGLSNRAPSAYESVFGSYATLYTPIDPLNFNGLDRAFTIGAGYDQNHRYNAMTVLKNGKIGIGTSTPLYPLHVYGESAIESGRLVFINTGQSIFIGENAGKMDDLTANQNVFIGQGSGQSNVSGSNNIAIGAGAVANSITSSNNIAIGRNTLTSNTTGTTNVAIGTFTLDNNTTGHSNTAIGYEALGSGSTNSFNTALGYSALRATTGNDNTAIGFEAGLSAVGGGSVFLGNEAGRNETGSSKLYIDNSFTTTPLIYGDFSTNHLTINDSLTSKYFQMTNGAGANKLLQSNAAGHGAWVDQNTLFTDDWTANGNHIYNSNSQNVGIGTNLPLDKLHVVGSIRVDGGRIPFTNSGQSVFIGENAGLADDLSNNNSVFIGHHAGKNNTSGVDNIAIGAFALDGAYASQYNIAIGQSVLGNLGLFGGYNIGIGNFSMENLTGGSNNLGLGQNVLRQNTAGNYNISIGNFSSDSLTSGNNNIAIGNDALGSCTNDGSNVAIGHRAQVFATGKENIAIGQEAGVNAAGDGNVFIGHQAGIAETGGGKLYIDNGGTATPLIYGDFSQNKIIINDSLQTKYFKMTNGAGVNKLLQSNAAGYGTWVDQSSIFTDDWTANGNNIYNNNSSNVGIGTTEPNEKLQVNGNLRIDAGRIYFENTGFGTFLGRDAGLNDVAGSSNGSTFLGDQAGSTNTTGGQNTSVGSSALKLNTTGHKNTAMGSAALFNNLTGENNIGLGYAALNEGTTGTNNIGIGFYALKKNNGQYNICLGDETGADNLAGSNNLFLGARSGEHNTGSGNIFFGYNSGQNESGNNKLYIDNSNTSNPLIYGDFSQNKITINDSLQAKYFKMTNGAANKRALQSDANGKGSWVKPYLFFEDTINVNIFLGSGVGSSATTAIDNTIIGSYAGEDLLSGYENTGFGKWSLQNITSATYNTALGHNSLSTNVTGNGNTAIGWSALAGATGASNVAMGMAAGGENTGGSQNVYIGTESGMNNSGSGNIFLGYKSGMNESGSNKMYIDNSNTSSPLIHGDFSTNEVTINDSLTVGKELGVGISTPNSTFEVNGSVAVKFKTPLVAGTTNPDGTGMVWRYNSGTGTITLPLASSCPNRIYVIINQTGTTRTISTYRDLVTNTQTTLGSSQALWIMSDGSEWWQIK